MQSSGVVEAQAEYFAFLRRAAESRDVSGAFAVRSGASSNTENGVVAHGKVDDVGDLIAWLRGAPASWLDLGGANRDALLAAGARPENDGREMVARIADLRLAPPDDVTVEPAAVDEWFDFAEAHGNWFGDAGERPTYERLYGGLVGERFRLYLARVDGETAGFAAAFYGSSFVLLTQVIVAERFRRRGVATALAAARLRTDKELAVLGPSPEGAKLYAALGFELRPTEPNRWYYVPC